MRYDVLLLIAWTNCVFGDPQWTALILASREGRVNAVRLLLECGADWTLTDKHRVKLLFLLDRILSSHPSQQDYGKTALQWARERGHSEVCSVIEVRHNEAVQFDATRLLWEELSQAQPVLCFAVCWLVSYSY